MHSWLRITTREGFRASRQRVVRRRGRLAAMLVAVPDLRRHCAALPSHASAGHHALVEALESRDSVQLLLSCATNAAQTTRGDGTVGQPASGHTRARATSSQQARRGPSDRQAGAEPRAGGPFAPFQLSPADSNKLRWPAANQRKHSCGASAVHLHTLIAPHASAIIQPRQGIHLV